MLTLVAALVSAALPCDHSLALGLGEPQVGAPAEVHAVAADAADRARVAELMARQDQLVLAHRGDLAAKDFTESFCACDWNCDSSRELLDRWDDYLHDHDDATIHTEIHDLHRVGETLVATVNRRFHGVRIEDGKAVDDDSAETLVLKPCEGQLKIDAIYETNARRFASLDRERRAYDRSADLSYTLQWPDSFVAVAREGPGAAMDQVLFLDPHDDAVMGLMVFDPTLECDLMQLMTGDCLDGSAEWNREPRRFLHPPAGFIESWEAEIYHKADPTRGAAGRESMGRVIYLSPDRRMVFALWIDAPPATFFGVRGKLDELARSIRLCGLRPGRSYTQAVFAQNPRWGTVADGLFRAAAAPIELPIPPGMQALPLAGDHILRLRLELEDDPGTSLLVRIFPPGEDRISADRILDLSVNHMIDVACAQSSGGTTRTSKTVDVLGRHGEMNGVEISCRDGSRRDYEIVAVDREECHVQVQILPGSDQRAKQKAALERVLAALRVRGK
jgi:hypothetical protein